jgi:hypothetical protein
MQLGDFLDGLVSPQLLSRRATDRNDADFSGACSESLMLKLLERNVCNIEGRLVLLAPPQTCVPRVFDNVDNDMRFHHALVREVQRMRGRIYLEDGAVQRHELSPEGLHETPEDRKSWHLIVLNKQHRVSACVWYLEHERATRMEQLRVRNCPLVHVDAWRDTLRNAVESELSHANEGRLGYAELGGWAVAEKSRRTCEGLLLALAAYSLGRLFGGALGITTATVRHSSSTILRRIGGSQLEANGALVPSYYDPKYKCEMELLRFDSRRPNPRYTRVIELLREKLTRVLVVGQPWLVPAVETAEFAPSPLPLQPSFAA